MKKKIVNGILLVAMLFATTSAFVSCKDTDSDVKAELDAKYAALEKKFNELQATVSQIKSCECEGKYYTKAEIDKKVSDLNAAIQEVKGLIPDVSGYLKASELPAKIQEALAGYYTKEAADEMFAKKSDIPAPVDLTDYLTKAQIEAIINEKLTGYVKTGDIPAVDLSNYLTKAEIDALLAGYAKKSDIPEIPTPTTTGLTEKEVNDLIDAKLQGYVKTAQIAEFLTKDEIIELIGEYIQDVNNKIENIYTKEVTSISVDKVVNPMFEFSTPFGVNSNVLIAFFGEKATRHIFFPKGSEEPIVWKGDYLLEGTGNAGKLYVTVNPSSVDFTGKTLKLVSTIGNEAPVELTPLEASDKELKYLTRSENTNAFYETYATIPEGKIGKAFFSWEPTDMAAFKQQIIDLLKGRGKEDIADMLQALTNLIAGNDVPAYRLQAEWSDGTDNYYTYSPANIAAVAIKPLSYAFDLAEEGQFNDTPINELEAIETYIVNRGTKTQSTRNKIWRWLNKFNKETNRWLNNINWALQPTMFIESEDEISRPGILLNYKTYPAGEITLIPSSWTVELLAPAFKKYVVVTDIDGNVVEGDLLGKVIPGSVKEIPLKIESGKKYNIEYSALDYAGNIRTLNYFIQGK